MTFGSIVGHFVDGAVGPLAIVVREPVGSVRGCVLVIPPFAEEMNKCRRMVAEVSMGLAGCGVVTVIPDLYGTGDSSGDFEDCTVVGWCNDIATVAQWASNRYGEATGLLAIRLGCSLAALSIGGLGAGVARSVMWQPVFDGAMHLKQFLRLRVMASLMSDRKESVAELRRRLEGGETLEVAGYRVSSRLAADLERLATPNVLPQALGGVTAFELTVGEADADGPAANGMLRGIARTLGEEISVQPFHGEPFWASTEVVVNGPLVKATIDQFCLPTAIAHA